MQPSASRSETLLQCSYPFSYADVEMGEDSPGEPARYGSAFHELIAVLLRGGKLGDHLLEKTGKKWKLPPASLRDLPAHVRSSHLLLDGWLRGKNSWARNFLRGGKRPETESSYALSLERKGKKLSGSVRRISSPTEDGHRYEDLREGEMAGTTDLIVDELVLDHKTGSAENFSNPSSKAQLKTFGLVPLFSKNKVPILGVLHADRRSLPQIYADESSKGDLEAHAVALERSLKRIGDGSLRPGPWCARCPMREACPAQHAELLKRSGEIVGTSMGIKPFLEGDDRSRSLMGPVDIGRVHQMFGELERLLKIGREEIRTWIEEHPSELVVRPDGKELEFVERSYERLSKASFVEALGAVKAEREFQRLRKIGVLTSSVRRELHAVRGGS
jgi:hypothetical protein